jgi:hypothetical protein
VVPERSVMLPDTPARPALGVSMSTLLELVAVPAPAAMRTEPPMPVKAAPPCSSSELPASCALAPRASPPNKLTMPPSPPSTACALAPSPRPARCPVA